MKQIIISRIESFTDSKLCKDINYPIDMFG